MLAKHERVPRVVPLEANVGSGFIITILLLLLLSRISDLTDSRPPFDLPNGG